MVDYIGDCRGNVRLPGIMMLGFVGAQSENLAMAVIVSKVTSCHLVSVSSSYSMIFVIFSINCPLGSGSAVDRTVRRT